MKKFKRWITFGDLKNQLTISTDDLLGIVYDGELKLYRPNSHEEVLPEEIRSTYPRAVGYIDTYFEGFLLKCSDVQAFIDAAPGDSRLSIEDLTLYRENDVEVVFSLPGKKPFARSADALEFRDTSTLQWKTLLRLLDQKTPTFSLGPSGTKEYNRLLNLYNSIERKIHSFIRKNLALELPEKLYTLDPTERPGTYRFLFQTSRGPVADEKQQTLDDLQKLADFYRSGSESMKDEHLKHFLELSKHALKRQWITNQEITDLISEKPDLRYEKEPYSEDFEN